MTEVEIMRMQIRALEDRCAMALSIMQDCEIVSAAGGDIETARWWELQQDLLLGKDKELLDYARGEQEQFGFYKASLAKVRAWLNAGVRKVSEAA